MSDESNETVERLERGVKITAKVKRGTGTRDQDEIRAKVKADDVEEARQQMDELSEHLEQWADDLRAIQPDDQ